MRDLIHRGAARAGRLLERRSSRSTNAFGIVLLHHEIAPQHGDDGNELVPALGEDIFRAQLEHLGRHYEVVPLTELLERARNRRAGQPVPAAITFDDDLSRHLSVAAPLLVQFGFPATFFLCGNSLQEPASFWWQDLQLILDRGAEAKDELHRELADTWAWAKLNGNITDLTDTIEASPPDQRDAIAAILRRLAGPQRLDDGLSADEVRKLADRGFEIGFHTRHHYALQTLAPDTLEQEMREGLDDLEAASGRRPTSIAYPYAKADLRIAEAAQRAGFELGVVGKSIVATPEHHPMLIPRVVAFADSIGMFVWSLGRTTGAA
jgi:peptidoglycan/xylan/chitin deacetylase (PgdA/CDA1 family)